MTTLRPAVNPVMVINKFTVIRDLATTRTRDPTPACPLVSLSTFFSDGIHLGHPSTLSHNTQAFSGEALISALALNFTLDLQALTKLV